MSDRLLRTMDPFRTCIALPGAWTVYEMRSYDGFYHYTLHQVPVPCGAPGCSGPKPEQCGEIEIRVPIDGPGQLTLGTIYGFEAVLQPSVAVTPREPRPGSDEVPF